MNNLNLSEQQLIDIIKIVEKELIDTDVRCAWYRCLLELIELLLENITVIYEKKLK